MLYLSITYSVIFGLLFGFDVSQLRAKATELSSTRQLIAEQVAKELAYHNVEQVLESTVADRDTLQHFFITEKDTIAFVSDVEAKAAALGVALETTQLSINPKKDKTPAQLYTGFKFSGPELSVKRLVTLLEAVPYYKTVPELKLTRKTDSNEWDGTILLYINIFS